VQVLQQVLQVLLVLPRLRLQERVQLEQQVLLVLPPQVLLPLQVQVLQEPLAPQNCHMQAQPQ
jgi:hypothetical protein